DGPAPGAVYRRRPALGRSLNAGVPQTPGGSESNRPNRAPHDLPPGIYVALAEPRPSHATHPHAPPQTAGGTHSGQCGRGEDLTTGSRAADRGENRWSALVCRRTNQGSAGIWPAPGTRGPLRADRTSPRTGDSRHPPGLADGAFGPALIGEGGGATGGHDWSAVCL